MPIAKVIADFAGAVEATRSELNKISSGISKLEQQRREIEQAQPHTDDIVAVFIRALRNGELDFERELASAVNGMFVGHEGAAAAGPDKALNVLRLEPKKLDREATITRAMRGEPAPLNVTVLLYLLRDKIEAEIPAMVEKVCPAARNGMKRSDREAALAEVDGELARLRSQATALNADLIAARTAISGRP